MLAKDATSCQWKLISGCCGLLPPGAPDLGRRLVGAGVPAALGTLVTSAALQSHLMCSGVSPGLQVQGPRVLDASRVEERPGGREFTTQPKSSLSLEVSPGLPAHRRFSLLFPFATFRILPSHFILWLELSMPPPSWVALSFLFLICILEIIIAPSS